MERRKNKLPFLIDSLDDCDFIEAYLAVKGKNVKIKLYLHHIMVS